MTYFKNFINDEEGQDLVEYALLLGFVAVAGVAAFGIIGPGLKKVWDRVALQLT